MEPVKFQVIPVLMPEKCLKFIAQPGNCEMNNRDRPCVGFTESISCPTKSGHLSVMSEAPEKFIMDFRTDDHYSFPQPD